jgi:P4 family phage/plasmid primase-like protien
VTTGKQNPTEIKASDGVPAVIAGSAQSPFVIAGPIADLPNGADFVTILTAHDGCRLTKTIYRREDGTLALHDYHNAYTYRARAHIFEDAWPGVLSPLEQLGLLLWGLKDNECIVHGGITAEANADNMRRLHVAKDGQIPTLEMVPHRWLAIDVDGVAAEDAAGAFDPLPDPARAVACVVAKLPTEFQGAECLWQFTSSAGIKDGIRMRLYFWLSRPLTCEEVGAWLTGYPVDHSIYRPSQPIYAASPVVEGDAVDPIPVRWDLSAFPELRNIIPGGLVTPPSVIAVKPAVEITSEPVDFTEDTDIDVARARQYLDKIDDPTEGRYAHAAMLRDFGISQDKAIELLADDDERVQEKVEHAWEYNQNAAGCKSFKVLYPDLNEALDAGEITLDEALWAERELFRHGPIRIAKETMADAERRILAKLRAETTGLGDDPIKCITGSDDHLALVFEAEHRGHLRFIPERGTWLDFTGERWLETDKSAIWNMIRPVARRLAIVELDQLGPQRTMTSKNRIAGAEGLCQGAMRAPADLWDADAYALNTPGGLVDLRTGVLGPTRADALCAKMTAVAPGGECPRWRKFLDEITAGDKELQSYLQRLIGYSLIGEVTEHVLPFLYGTGGNGKGVFLGTVAAIMGDYAKTAPMGMFTETMGDRHPADMAMLAGARFVTGQEVDAGKHWAEAKVKALTGGDVISARFMHQNFFEYRPQFTLLIAGNHKPRLHHVDEAIRRRLHMIPFTVTVANPDIHLADKLKAEWPGILRWAIEGCVEWQRLGGLCAPSAVVEMTEEYLEAENPAAEWLEDCCDLDPNRSALPAELSRSYRNHCNENGVTAMQPKEFSQWLTDQGFQRIKSHGTRAYHGLRLKTGDLSQEIAF